MSLPHIPGMRPGDASSSIPFSKAAPRDKKQELRKFYREAGLVLDRAKADTVELKTTNPARADQERRNLLKDKADYRSEREMDLANFRELMDVFKTQSSGGNGKLSLAQFKSAFAVVFGSGLTDTQMSLLFCQVDANMDEAVDWDEFSTFMLLRAEGQSIMREQAETQLFDEAGAKNPVSPHKDHVVRISWLEKVGKYLTCGRDGTVCIWSDRWKMQRCFMNVGQHHAVPGENAKNHTPWIHDCAFLPNVNKIAMSSDDHAITFYDFTTMEPQLRLDLHDTVALSLSCYYEENNADSDTTMLLFGTDSGHTSVLTFTNTTFFPPTPVPTDHTPAFLIDSITKIPGTTLWKRKAHGDWTLQVEYFHDVRSIVSCSADPRESLVMATQTGAKKWRIVSASVRKGVSTFAYSKFPLALLTGGVDRQIRIWNPHRLTRPTASLSGHSSPITALTVNPCSGQVISLSVDRNIKIWDIRKQICLQTIIPGLVEHRAENTLSALLFNPFNGGKLIAASTGVVVYGLAVKEQHRGAVKSHEAPVRAALWNSVFEQVVSGCDASVINVWDATTGQKTFRFADVHDKAEITAMAFDSGCRRLITGGRDGTMRVWNFHNGQLLQELIKGDNAEVTSILFISLKSTPHIVATGWNRLIQLFPANSDGVPKVHPTLTMPAAHSDDVLTMAFCPPDLLATASYDGEIVLSNLGGAGVVVGRLKVDDPLGRRVSVDKVLFLEQRAHLPRAANLISSGSDGIVRWWNTHEMELMLEQDATDDRREGVFSMCLNAANTVLVTGDAGGTVSVWDIRRACIKHDATGMDLVHAFRAHVRSVVSLDLTDWGGIVSASTDCTVRMWTLAGDYIGTFGQPTPWEITNPSTYSPQKPPEVAQFESDTADLLEMSRANIHDVEGESSDLYSAETAADGSAAVGLALGNSQQRTSTGVNTAKPDSASRPPTSSNDLAALASPTYRTWYANSLFATSKLTHRRRPRALPPLNLGKSGAFPVGGGIFHCLQPYELGETGNGANILRVGKTGGKR
ncbi:WD40-repeat-containing domain protein [Powellomyces hirtus]|nr:WD40-repeat-containing domain protein [Powellomyces hirtus]